MKKLNIYLIHYFASKIVYLIVFLIFITIIEINSRNYLKKKRHTITTK